MRNKYQMVDGDDFVPRLWASDEDDDLAEVPDDDEDEDDEDEDEDDDEDDEDDDDDE